MQRPANRPWHRPQSIRCGSPTGPYAPCVASGLAGVAAAVVVAVHLCFLAYIVLGGFLALRWPALLWPSIAATVYSAYVTLASFTCPLTTLEKWLLQAGGTVPYEGSFIAQYVRGTLYPPEYETAIWITAMAVAIASQAFVLMRRRWHAPAQDRLLPS